MFETAPTPVIVPDCKDTLGLQPSFIIIKQFVVTFRLKLKSA